MKNLQKYSEIIKKGGIIAIPTETVYGLAGNYQNKETIKKIFKIKGRPNDNPLIIHIAEKNDLLKLAKNISKKALKLIKAFWPGPLTLVLEKKETVPNFVTANLNTVAVRLPDNLIMQEIIKESQCFLAAPSANLSGKPSSTNYLHIKEDFKNQIDAIIKSPPLKYGLESTVIDMTISPPCILRPGNISKTDIEKIIGKININTKQTKEKPHSPGIKYKHYAPNYPLITLPFNLIKKNLTKLNKLKTAFIIPHKSLDQTKFTFILNTSSQCFGQNFYEILRQTNHLPIDFIVCSDFQEFKNNEAFLNRLEKAKTKHINQQKDLEIFLTQFK
jgi:L-threonylcarbamoyladenylate synthase